MNNKEIALKNIDVFQREIDRVVTETEKMKKVLENLGWEIKLSSGYLNSTVECTASKEVGKDKRIVFKKRAKCHKNDVFIREFGDYLALAKVYTEIKEWENQEIYENVK